MQINALSDTCGIADVYTFARTIKHIDKLLDCLIHNGYVKIIDSDNYLFYITHWAQINSNIDLRYLKPSIHLPALIAKYPDAIVYVPQPPKEGSKSRKSKKAFAARDAIKAWLDYADYIDNPEYILSILMTDSYHFFVKDSLNSPKVSSIVNNPRDERDNYADCSSESHEDAALKIQNNVMRGIKRKLMRKHGIEIDTPMFNRILEECTLDCLQRAINDTLDLNLSPDKIPGTIINKALDYTKFSNNTICDNCHDTGIILDE